MKNSDKIILDLCGATGSFSKPYKEAGYDVRVITLPDYDVREYAPACELENDVYKVYGILAAPPCTQFSLARREYQALTPRDLEAGMETVKACLNIIWWWQLQETDCHLKFWALENPKGLLQRILGKPYLEFNPCDFGDPWTKPTDLWGFFNKPKINPIKVNGGRDRWSDSSKFTAADKESPNCTDEYHKKVGGERRVIRRAITPPGFAQAFFKANR